MKPSNRDDSFEIDPLSFKLVWRKMLQEEFYLTPLGLYITTIVLYLCYLALFTYISTQQIQVYDEYETDEIIFWTLNFGYVLNECHQMYTLGPRKYFAVPSNYFDIIVSAVFVSLLLIRIIAVNTEPYCEGYLDENGEITTEEITDKPCWANGQLNTAFIILWGMATITLWLRLITFCTLSYSLGPMIQMIFKMLGDIITFFEIMLILYLGFSFALVFIMSPIHPDFDNPIESGLTLFRAILGDFSFGVFVSENEANDALIYFGYTIMLLYLVIGSVILLNL